MEQEIQHRQPTASGTTCEIHVANRFDSEAKPSRYWPRFACMAGTILPSKKSAAGVLIACLIHTLDHRVTIVLSTSFRSRKSRRKRSKYCGGSVVPAAIETSPASSISRVKEAICSSSSPG